MLHVCCTKWGPDGSTPELRSDQRRPPHSSSFARLVEKAALAAGRPDATPPTLRHTGASLATSVGATTADVMARLGHATPGMAMHYQHNLDGADARVADALSRILEG
jgi:integrase